MNGYLVSTAWNPPPQARRRFMVLNVEQFQLADSRSRIERLLAEEVPDFVVLDEVQKFKQRDASLSRRRACLLFMIARAAESNPTMRLLAMTGTPVINNLFEARSLIELCTLSSHGDLEVKPTIMNAMRVHSRLARLGLRYRPDLLREFAGIERLTIDVSLRRGELASAKSRYDAELILIREKLAVMAAAATPRSVIYCELVDEVHEEIAAAVRQKGRTVGFFNGGDKSGLAQFKSGQIDCLIASNAIGTGIDGLQHCTSRLIIATLPWTASDFDQLLGRFFRPKSDGTVGHVDVLVPWTVIPDPKRPDGEWSLDKARWLRSRYKATLADTAVDGVLPRGELRTADQAFADLQSWLLRIGDATGAGAERPALVVQAPAADEQSRNPAQNELAAFHGRLAGAWSSSTHTSLGAAPDRWRWYHEEVARVSTSWPFKPVDRCADWIRRRLGRRGGALVVADLGCGLAELAGSLGSSCVVMNFDHVAGNRDVTVANVARAVPLEDGAVDVAVLSLVLDWQKDWEGCLSEAARILAVDGQLLIWETPSFLERIGGIDVLIEKISLAGLQIIQRFDERFVGLVAGKF